MHKSALIFIVRYTAVSSFATVLLKIYFSSNTLA